MWAKLKKKIRAYFKTHDSQATKVKADPTAVVVIAEECNISNKIRVGRDSKIDIGTGSKITSEMEIGQGCSMTIGRQCKISKTRFILEDNALVKIGDGVIFDSPISAEIRVKSGTLIIAEKAHIQSDILVRFGGHLQIGKYTGIGYGSLIRCEEHVEIGAYGLFSYDLRIFDTNTHSVDWKERRQIIENGYPMGANELTKPDTSPVRIGDDVWIGDGATIMKGTSIGDRCIVGTRTVVSRGDYKSDSVIIMDKPRIIHKSKGRS